MAEVVELKKGKIFSLKDARGLLPVVKKITCEAVGEAEQLTRRMEESLPEPSHEAPYEKELVEIVDRWSQKILKLGCTPKGLWLVDFDNGEGYYCWHHPEEELGFYHTYEGAFAGRTPIL